MTEIITNLKDLIGHKIKAVCEYDKSLFLRTSDDRVFGISAYIDYDNAPEWTVIDPKDLTPYVLRLLDLLSNVEYENVVKAQLAKSKAKQKQRDYQEYNRLKAIFEKET